MFYKVDNFEGVCEYYSTNLKALKRFRELEAEGYNRVEVTQYKLNEYNGKYAGSLLYSHSK